MTKTVPVTDATALWTTADEIEYLTNFPARKAKAKDGKLARTSVADFYHGYIEAAKKRARWGRIDKAAVIAIATGFYYQYAR